MAGRRTSRLKGFGESPMGGGAGMVEDGGAIKVRGGLSRGMTGADERRRKHFKGWGAGRSGGNGDGLKRPRGVSCPDPFPFPCPSPGSASKTSRASPGGRGGRSTACY